MIVAIIRKTDEKRKQFLNEKMQDDFLYTRDIHFIEVEEINRETMRNILEKIKNLEIEEEYPCTRICIEFSLINYEILYQLSEITHLLRGISNDKIYILLPPNSGSNSDKVLEVGIKESYEDDGEEVCIRVVKSNPDIEAQITYDNLEYWEEEAKKIEKIKNNK